MNERQEEVRTVSNASALEPLTELHDDILLPLDLCAQLCVLVRDGCVCSIEVGDEDVELRGLSHGALDFLALLLQLFLSRGERGRKPIVRELHRATLLIEMHHDCGALAVRGLEINKLVSEDVPRLLELPTLPTGFLELLLQLVRTA